jgi:hypothetical protein
MRYYREEGIGLHDPEKMDREVWLEQQRKDPNYNNTLVALAMHPFQHRLRAIQNQGVPPGLQGQGTPANIPAGQGGQFAPVVTPAGEQSPLLTGADGQGMAPAMPGQTPMGQGIGMG